MDALREFERAWARTAASLAQGAAGEAALRAAGAAARRAVEWAAFARSCSGAGIDAPAELAGPGAHGGPGARLAGPDLDAPLAPDDLGRLHQRLAGLRLARARDGRLRAVRATGEQRRSGIVYTPECVARYVAEHALARPTGGGRAPIIVDPACGCGAFLLAAWRHVGQAFQPDHRPDRVRLESLTYGVDVDAEAVLVARRALWLEAMPGPSPSGRRRLLDALARQIVCADALCGTALAPLEGKADAVLGNPPYCRERGAKELLDRVAATALGRRWRTARMDLWYYFVHRGLELLRPGGVLSFIVPSYWTAGRGAEKLIGQLRGAAVEELFLLDDVPVFPGVKGRHMILRVRKGPAGGPIVVKRAVGGDVPSPPAPLPRGEGRLEDLLAGRGPLAVFCKTPEQVFRVGGLDLGPPCDEAIARLEGWPPLSALGRVRQGIVENPAQVTRRAAAGHGGAWRVGEGVFALTPEELEALDLPARERAIVRPYHDLCDLGRYCLAECPSRRLIYSTPGTWPDLGAFPSLARHLARFRPLLEARREVRQGRRAWWHLHWPREESIWAASKVVALQMARRPSFAAAEGPVYVPFSANVFVPHPERRESVRYFAAVLNSGPLEAWFCRRAKRRGVGLEISGAVLARAPMRPVDFSDPADRARHDRLVELAAAGDEAGIDRVVWELYGQPVSARGQ